MKIKNMKQVKEHMKDMNMKRLFRRNQIIITTLAVMIAAAGYLNYAMQTAPRRQPIPGLTRDSWPRPETAQELRRLPRQLIRGRWQRLIRTAPPRPAWRIPGKPY